MDYPPLMLPVQLHPQRLQPRPSASTASDGSGSEQLVAAAAATAALRPSPLGAALKAIGKGIRSISKGIQRRAGRRKKRASSLELEAEAAAAAAAIAVDLEGPPSLQLLEQQSQLCQRRLIAIQRKLNQASNAEDEARRRVAAASVELEEMKEHKRSLCDQLQLVVETANRERSAKLAAVADKYAVE